MEEPLDRLRLNATKCRDLASTAITPAAREVLDDLAREYDEKAATLSKRRASSRRPAFAWPA
jgi:hypothetical protein